VPDESPYKQLGEPNDNHFKTNVVMNLAAQDHGHNKVTSGDSGSGQHPLALYTWETGTSDPEHAYQNSEQVVLTFTYRNYRKFSDANFFIIFSVRNISYRNKSVCTPCPKTNGGDVQRKNVVNNVDKSSLWAP